MRIARVLLSSATLLTAACASAAPNKPGADLMGPLLSAAAELRQTDWSSLSTETSLALLRKHFGETSIRVTRPGPTEDAGSVAWEGAVSDGTCTWCVVLLES